MGRVGERMRVNKKDPFWICWFRRFGGEFGREISEAGDGEAETADERRRRGRRAENETVPQERPAEAVGGFVVGQRPEYPEVGEQRARTIAHALSKRCFRGT